MIQDKGDNTVWTGALYGRISFGAVSATQSWQSAMVSHVGLYTLAVHLFILSFLKLLHAFQQWMLTSGGES
jgi:hypothetical protein